MSSENYRVEKQDGIYFLTFTVTDWVDVAEWFDVI
jgi:hypothetical protein